MQQSGEHYLKQELYELMRNDSGIFEFLQKGSLDGIWYWDLENPDHEWFSPEIWRLLGYEPAEKQHLASEWQEMIYADDLQVALNNCEAHCANAAHPYDQVVRYRHKNGSTVWVRCRGMAIRDDNGKAVRFLGCHTDVSALKRSEAELSKLNAELELRISRSTAELEQVYASVPIGLVLVDTDFRFVHVNETAAALNAKPVEEHIGYTLREVIPGLADQVEAILARVISSGEPVLGVEIEGPLPSDPGATSHWQASHYPMKSAHGDVWAVNSVFQDITERKRAEEALRGSESKYRTLVNSAPFCIHEIDLDGRLISMNPSGLSMMGVEEECKVQGLDYASIAVPKDRDRIAERFSEALQGNSSLFEFEASTDSGPVYFDSCFVPIRDGLGSVSKIMGITQDITERKQADAALIKSQRLYEEAEELGRIGHWEWDFKIDKLIDCSEQYARIHGLTKEEMLTTYSSCEEDLKLVHPEDLDYYMKVESDLREKHEALSTEYRIITTGGVVRHVHELTNFEVDGNGAVIRAFGTLQDTTERKQAEQALQRSEQRFRILYDDNPIMLFTADESGTVLSGNMFGIDELGYSRDQFEGKRLADLFHEEDRSLALEYLKQCFADPNRVHNWELRRIRRNGTEFYAYETARVVDDIDGKPTALIVCEDVTDKRRLSEQLSHQATHDVLTNLINRREFERRLERVLDTIDQDQSEHAMCYIDLDQFKVVNDTCGHVAGDEMLRQISAILQQKVRKRDTLARLGGDEFGILMENCPLDQMNRVMSSLLESVQEFQFHWEGRIFRVGVSVGLVAITADTPNVTELLKRADAACYMAKDQGRNRVHVYHPEDAELAKRHGEMQWVAKLHHALEGNLFVLYAQPIVPLGKQNDGSARCELLVRMRDEDGALIQPGLFLPAAERYNLINRIDRWVITSAFQAFKAHLKFNSPDIHFAINLSGQSLAEPGMLDFIVDQLRAHEIEPKQVCFEITETAAISNLQVAIRFISSLRSLGLKFALDDFGSGLSSFGYLKNLKVDYLKIDGMFVKDIVSDGIAHAMVKSINEIGHVMGIQTIAEFVENEEIKGMLREMGVDHVQGYGVGKPQPLQELFGRINNTNTHER